MASGGKLQRGVGAPVGMESQAIEQGAISHNIQQYPTFGRRPNVPQRRAPQHERTALAGRPAVNPRFSGVVVPVMRGSSAWSTRGRQERGDGSRTPAA
jgi:hypothetical protein